MTTMAEHHPITHVCNTDNGQTFLIASSDSPASVKRGRGFAVKFSPWLADEFGGYRWLYLFVLEETMRSTPVQSSRGALV